MERRDARFKLKSEETIVSIKTEKGWDMQMLQPLNVYLFLITLNILLFRFKKIKPLYRGFVINVFMFCHFQHPYLADHFVIHQ